MAEINSGNSSLHKRNSGVRKLKKQSTRIDLTPMVDLGFLLITFFIFTTSLCQPHTMSLSMPLDSPIQMPISETGALTIIPVSNGNVYFYEGKLDKTGSNLQKRNSHVLRNILIEKKKNTPPGKLFIIIKPTKSSTYKDLVNVLDEMLINQIKSYSITDITKEEQKWIHE